NTRPACTRTSAAIVATTIAGTFRIGSWGCFTRGVRLRTIASDRPTAGPGQGANHGSTVTSGRHEKGGRLGAFPLEPSCEFLVAAPCGARHIPYASPALEVGGRKHIAYGQSV